MLLKDFQFDESGTAGWPLDKTHFVELTKRADLNAETFEFDVELVQRTTLVGGKVELVVKRWENLDPVAAQCIVWSLSEGNYDEPATSLSG